MKMKITEYKEYFKPISIEITLETMEELNGMIKRLGFSTADIDKKYKYVIGDFNDKDIGDFDDKDRDFLFDTLSEIKSKI